MNIKDQISKIKNLFFPALFLVFIIGLLIRIWNLGSNPAGFFADEASIGYNAYSVLKSGKDEWGYRFPLLFKAFGQYKDPVLIYTAIPFIKIFGLSEFSIRITSVFYGMLAILAIFLLTKELFDSKVGLFSALFLAISPWHVHFSRIGFELISSTFWLPFSLFLFLKSLKKFETYYPVFAVSALITFFTYYPIKIIWPILLILTFFVCFKTTKKWLTKKQFWIINLIIVFVFVFLMIPYFKDGLFLSRWKEVKNDSLKYEDLVKGYVNHFSWNFLFKTGDIDFSGQFITRHSVRGIGELYIFQLPLIIFALIHLMMKKRKEALFLIVFLLLYPLGTVFTDIKPQATRSIIGVIPFQILSGYGLVKIISLFKRRITKIFLVLIFSVILGMSLNKYLNLFYEYPIYSSDYWGWQYGPGEIISYFKFFSKDYDELYMTGSFNAPEIFLKFYDPEGKCKNCFIGGVDRYDQSKKQLFAFTSEEMEDIDWDFKIKKIIYYPNRDKAFSIIEPISNSTLQR